MTEAQQQELADVRRRLAHLRTVMPEPFDMARTDDYWRLRARESLLVRLLAEQRRSAARGAANMADLRRALDDVRRQLTLFRLNTDPMALADVDEYWDLCARERALLRLLRNGRTARGPAAVQ
jgi:hypothetical protein